MNSFVREPGCLPVDRKNLDKDRKVPLGHSPVSQSPYCLTTRDLRLYSQFQNRDSIEIHSIVFNFFS